MQILHGGSLRRFLQCKSKYYSQPHRIKPFQKNFTNKQLKAKINISYTIKILINRFCVIYSRK